MSMQYMQTFCSKKEFNEYCKRENEVCDKYAGDDGALHFESDAEFENLMRELMPEFQHIFFYD